MNQLDENEMEIAARREEQYQRLGTRDPSCKCGETHPSVLTGAHPNILCHRCLARKQGRWEVEEHHFAGQHNDTLTVPLPINDHGFITDIQQTEWPERTLENPLGSPLLKASASIRGVIAFIRLLTERVFGWIPPFLERLDQFLGGM